MVLNAEKVVQPNSFLPINDCYYIRDTGRVSTTDTNCKTDTLRHVLPNSYGLCHKWPLQFHANE